MTWVSERDIILLMFQGAEHFVRALWRRTWVAWHSVRQRHLLFPSLPTPCVRLGRLFHTCTCNMGGYCRAATLYALSALSELQGTITVIIFSCNNSLRCCCSDEQQDITHLGIQVVSLPRKVSQGRSWIPRKGFSPRAYMPLRTCRDFISVNKIISLSVSFFSINISGGGSKRSLLLH